MTAKRYLYAALAACLLMLTGCRDRKDLGGTISTLDGNAIQTAIENDTSTSTCPKLMQANFTCEVEGLKVTCQARMSRDSLIWVSAYKVIDLGRAVLTPDSVLVYIKMNNSYYRCDYKYLESKFGVKTNYAMLQEALVQATQKPSTMTIPIRSSQINTDARLKFDAATFPEKLTFPFSIPASAKKMTMDMF